MLVKCAGFSHKGLVRKTNQDYSFASTEFWDSSLGLLIVADGMGGHNAGDVASKTAVETVVKYFEKNRDTQLEPVLLDSIRIANQKVYDFSLTYEGYTDMGTTLTVACIYDGKVYVGHVGDSRAYILKNKKLVQLTRDHSLVQELFDMGTISQEQMENHPNKNILTRALGFENDFKADFCERSLEDEDIILLTTDGLNLHLNLWNHLSLLTSGLTVQEIVDSLGEKVLNAGAADNITLIAAQYFNGSK